MEDNRNREHLAHLSEIRSIMDQSTRFISLSGLTGVFAGIFALAGAFAAYWHFGYHYYTPDFLDKIMTPRGAVKWDFLIFLFTDAGLVFLLTLAFGIFFSFRQAVKKGHSIWNKAVQRMLINLFIPLITGGFFCIALLIHGAIYLIAPATLIFYGLALINAGKYTLRDIKYMGLLYVVLGLTASFITGYGLVFWAVGFGIFHIAYGIFMYIKYDLK